MKKYNVEATKVKDECSETLGHDINVDSNGNEYFERCNRCGKEWFSPGKRLQKELKDKWGIKNN